MTGYLGEERRDDVNAHLNEAQRHPGQMSLVISGNRMPMLAIITMIASLLVSVVYATVWLTKLDDRILKESEINGQQRQLLAQHSKLLSRAISDQKQTAFILNQLLAAMKKQ